MGAAPPLVPRKPTAPEGRGPAASLGQAGHWPVAVAHLEAHPEDVAAHGEIYGLLHHAVLWAGRR